MSYLRREYRLQVLNSIYWKIEEYKEDKFIRQFGAFTSKKQAEQVAGMMRAAIQAFIEDNNLDGYDSN